jgi:hypothetical protein
VGPCVGLREQGSKAFFFEKKKQKTFDCFGCGPSSEAQRKHAKVFWFFFSKKNSLLAFMRVA